MWWFADLHPPNWMSLIKSSCIKRVIWGHQVRKPFDYFRIFSIIKVVLKKTCRLINTTLVNNNTCMTRNHVGQLGVVSSRNVRGVNPVHKAVNWINTFLKTCHPTRRECSGFAGLAMQTTKVLKQSLLYCVKLWHIPVNEEEAQTDPGI